MMKTYTAKPADIQRKWWVIDASGVPIGRLATRVATLLQGKHKPTYERHMDMGDHVIIIHAEKVRATGDKELGKVYYWHTGFPGGIKSETLKERRGAHPERILETAIKGMLPKGSLGRDMFRKLKVYAGATHQHTAQQPEPYSVEG